jgi:hypothetical protein
VPLTAPQPSQQPAQGQGPAEPAPVQAESVTAADPQGTAATPQTGTRGPAAQQPQGRTAQQGGPREASAQ